jgi:hypothetical protein
MLLRKQTDFNKKFQVTLDFQPSHPGYEAGIVVSPCKIALFFFNKNSLGKTCSQFRLVVCNT